MRVNWAEYAVWTDVCRIKAKAINNKITCYWHNAKQRIKQKTVFELKENSIYVLLNQRTKREWKCYGSKMKATADCLRLEEMGI